MGSDGRERELTSTTLLSSAIDLVSDRRRIQRAASNEDYELLSTDEDLMENNLIYEYTNESLEIDSIEVGSLKTSLRIISSRIIQRSNKY